ncbi:MAG TPA: energy transducer TonB [Gemmatimonadaceae bacterium]|nr:energy transducer TonB [Gemmatimonadaceae bacterium]
MLETLLESRSRRRRSSGGALVSVTAHTALIAAALYATAEARVDTRSAIETVRPVYFPPTPIGTAANNASHSPSATNVSPRLPVVGSIDVEVQPLPEIALAPPGAGDFHSLPAGGLGTESVGPVLDSGATYSADQVEKQVEPAPGNSSPRYPDVLRAAGVEGSVIAQFVVDEAGRAEESTLRFVRGDNALFEDAVRTALRRMRFVPAEVGGKKVRQLVQMPFVFTLSR